MCFLTATAKKAF